MRKKKGGWVLANPGSACVERCCACRHRHLEAWPRPGSDAARQTSLATRHRLGVFQAGSDSSPVSTLGSTCVPPTVNYLQYLPASSIHTAIGPFQLPAPQSGTLSRISSGTRSSVQNVWDVCIKRSCLFDTSAFSALEVLDNNCAL